MSTDVGPEHGAGVLGGGGRDVLPGPGVGVAGGDDHSALAWFIEDLRDTFRREFTSHPDLLGGQAISNQMLESLSDLNEIIASAVTALRAPDGAPPSEKLEQAGLTGSRLALKLSAYTQAKEGYFEARDYSSAPGFIASVRERLRPSRRFKRILRRANIVLGSLTSVFPVIEPFKEYKEAAEASVDEAIEDAEEEAESVS